MARRRAFSAGGELVSKTIDSVINGVSQQPPTIRLSSMCEAQDNMLSNATTGVERRPPSEHIDVLHTAALPTEGYKVHIRDRDATTQHLVLIENGDIRVFNLFTGVEATVTDTSGTYLNITGTDASQAYAITSVADYSFVVNKETTVDMSGTVTAARTNEFMIYWIESGHAFASQDFVHTLGTITKTGQAGGSGQGTDSSPSACIDKLNTTLYTVGNFPDWTFVQSHHSVLHGEQTGDIGNPQLPGVPSHQYSDEIYTFIGPQTQRFSDLPAKGVDTFVTEVTGADGNENNNYWVAFDDALAAWVETVGPTLDNGFDAATMPHVLIQTSATVFTFGPQAWGARTKGDIDSAPEPSFVGKEISDIFFYKNRLGFLADESVILSEAGSFFNFWPTTVTTLVDSDPIDAASTNNRIALLDYAVPFDNRLFLFSGRGGLQNVLAGGDTLTNANAQVTEASAFPTSPTVRAESAGKEIFFVVDKTVSSSILEYKIKEGIADAFDLTVHIPTYLPANIRDLSISLKENILAAVSPDKANIVYIHRFVFDSRGTKIMNSWSQWIFDTSYTIRGASWVGEILYLVVERAGPELILEKIDVAKLVDGDLTHRVHLDSLVELTGVYTVADDMTRWTTPYDSNPATFGTYEVVLSGTTFGDDLGRVLPLSYEASSGKMFVQGDFSGDSAHIGRTFQHNYEFTKALITAPSEDGRSKVPVTQGRLQISKFKVLVQTSAGFEARVTSSEVNPAEVVTAEAEYLYDFPNKILGAGTVGVVNPKPVAEFLFDVGVESKYARIRITGSSHLPFTLVGGEWSGNYSVRESRV